MGKLHNFFHTPQATGLVLLLCAITAITLSNLEATSLWYASIWHIDFTIGFDGFFLSKPLSQWINDALMAVFFFTIGLEIKREIVVGEFRSFRQSLLPISAALGGMIFPALVFTVFNYGTPTSGGWGIPMATDIVFALGILSLMGKRVPLSLKVTLTTLAVVDDFGAILKIAIFYSSEIDYAVLIAAGSVFAFLVLLGKLEVHKLRWYLVPAVILWVLFLKSGIHATISGVLVAMTLPATSRFSKESFCGGAQRLLEKFMADDVNHVQVIKNEPQRATLQNMRVLARNTMSPVQRLEHALHSTVMFLIIPLFALCNAGVVVPDGALSMLFSPLSVGIILGLVLGKPLGVMLFSWVVIKLGFASPPSGATWGSFIGVSCLAGIGFTMSMYISTLEFSDPVLIAQAKISILVASVFSGLMGVVLIRLFGVRG